MQTRRNLYIHLFLVLVVAVLIGSPVVSAQDQARLDISSIDKSEFPAMRLFLIAVDGQSQRLPDLNGLQLGENGTAITDFDVGDLPVGTEIYFVIDANGNINARDEAGGLTRREKTRDSIVNYAQNFMDKNQMDYVTIIVPDGGTAAVLGNPAMNFPNEVINEINFFEPQPVGDAPVNDMLSLALDLAAEKQAEGRFQAVVLFSDAGQLNQQLDYPSLVAKAQAGNVPIFGAILGAGADANEIDNMNQLAGPTRGTVVHMPQPEATDPIYATVQSNHNQYEVQYESTLTTSGQHQVTAEMAGALAEANVDLQILPPEITIVVDNTRPIVRVASDPEAPLSAAEPSSQPMVAQVSWPDGYPRSLTEALLIVDGQPQPVVSEPVDADGLITLEWDISNLEDETYLVAVKALDQLGLTGQSDALPMKIELEGVGAAPPPTGGGQPQPEPGQPAVEESGGLFENMGVVGILLGFLGLLIAIVVLVFVVVLLRGRRSEPQVQPQAAVPVSAGSDEHEATQVIMPAFASRSVSGAYLEPLENAPDHRGNIPLATNNVAIGRDPKLAQIVLTDKSVSRLHARILEKGGRFQLYDEGSASGTYINYEQVSLTPQPIKDNDDVHIGRVHLRFHMAPVAAEEGDSTQVMGSPPRPDPVQPAPADDGLSTQVYVPQGSPPAGQGRPAQPPPPPPAAPSGGDDADDISTKPYMPHSPRR